MSNIRNKIVLINNDITPGIESVDKNDTTSETDSFDEKI